jgi:hypothetical protein
MIATPGELYIQNRLGLGAYRRAQGYHRSGAIQGATRDGMTLRARCKGSTPEPYRVWVTLDERRVVVASCSCPVGATGRCKHVGALLLEWRSRPETFRDHREGVALGPVASQEEEPTLRELAEAFPELGWVASRVATGRGERGGAEVFQRACRRLLGSGPCSYEAVRKLLAVKAAAERAQVSGEIGRAAAAYEGLLRALLERPWELESGGTLASLSVSCAYGLGRCLGSAAGPVLRRELLKTLYFALRSGVDGGGLPLGGAAAEALQRSMREEERLQVLRWLEAVVDGAPDGPRQEYGGLWMKLVARGASAERLLAIARRSGRVADAVDRLLLLGRVEEARSEAQGAAPWEAVAVARHFQAHGHRALGIQVLEAVRADERPVEVLDELASELEASGEQRRAMTWAMEAMRLEPTVVRYREVKRLGRKGGQWNALRLAIEAWLLGAGEEAMLASVYLDEGAIEEAISLAQRSPSVEVKEAVARACEPLFPRESLALYQQIVEAMVAERGRDGYQQARAQLRAMKKLHGQLGEGPSWATVAARLRGRYVAVRKAS